jgi:precorrin-6Y C5,15-methyltransferase (decarboxylating)
MSDPWLHVVGIGEDGLDGLTPATRAVVEAAEVILGGDRHHDLSGNITAERLSWPSPFNAMIETIRGLKGRRAVILVTGDPLSYSVGARIGRPLPHRPRLRPVAHDRPCRHGWRTGTAL